MQLENRKIENAIRDGPSGDEVDVKVFERLLRRSQHGWELRYK